MKIRCAAGTVSKLLAMGTGLVLFTMCGKDRSDPEGGMPAPEPPAHIDTLYVTGVEYPAGYDWVKDQEYGTVECRLFLEKAGERIVEVPVGYSYETASDPDMHRCVDGHLYTDYSTDTETVIKRDGVTLFRYQGREVITCFHVSDSSDVYTVGRPRSGGPGFTFRMNGQELIAVEEGKAVYCIQEKDGRVYLAYRQESRSGGAADTRPGYYLYDGTRPVLISELSDDEEILSVFVTDTDVIYVAGYKKWDMMQSGYLYRDGKKYPLSGEYGTLAACRILHDGEGIYLAGICNDSMSGKYRYAVWDGYGSPVYTLTPGMIPYYSFAEGGDVYDFIQSEGVFNDISCMKNGNAFYSYGQDLSSYGNAPAAVCRDSLYFAFSDRGAGRKPCIAADDRVRDYSFNGFFTGVSVW